MIWLLLLVGLIVGGTVVYNTRRRLDETLGRVLHLEQEVEILRGKAFAAEPDRAAAGPAPEAPPESPSVEPVEPDLPTQGPGPTQPEPPEAKPEPEPVLDLPEDAWQPSRPRLEIDWERWIGVRGAALLGGIVLALAAILFLKFSIERGLIPPIVRVALGVITGIGALVGSEVMRKRYETTANSVAGAGVVILYASIWAARTLYDLIPITLAFVFMVLVTVVCGLLSYRHHSQVIGILGIVGGFATPLLLASEEDRPIGLFGYILLLDAGLIALARRRRWPLLPLLAVAGTAFYQLSWILGRMAEGQALIGLAVLAIFAVLFALAGGLSRDSAGALWKLTSGAGVLIPFFFAVHFAARADLDVELWQLGVLLALLSGAASKLGKVLGLPLLGTGAAGGVLGVVAVWVLRSWTGSGSSDGFAWELVGVAAGLALVFQLLGCQDPADEFELTDVTEPAFVAAAGFLGLSLLPLALNAASIWPALVGWIALAGLLALQGRPFARGYRTVLGAGGLAAGFLLLLGSRTAEGTLPEPAIFFGLLLLVAVAFQCLAFLQARGEPRTSDEVAAATFPLLVLTGFHALIDHPAFGPAVFFATTIALAFLVALAATRGRLGGIYPVVVALLALVHTAWTFLYFRWSVPQGEALAILLTLLGAATLFALWPFAAGKAFAANRWVIYGAALAPAAWFFATRRAWTERLGDGAIGALPVILGLLALAAAALARRRWAADDPEQRRSMAWFLAVALGFVTLAIPLQLDKEWITIGWALQGFAMVLLWSRLDHAGLKYFGLALLAVASLRLLLNPEVLGYYEKSAWPILNWLMYTYLLPAAALLGTARLLAPLEVPRLRPWEIQSSRPLGSLAAGLTALLVVFAWINLTICDYFSPPGYIQVFAARHPARDLTLSLAWIGYAVLLLAIGMARKSVAMRWVSLVFLIVSFGKVALYDLGELRDLYRVASLAGLAISLLLVSLAYQRFVFSSKDEKGKDG